MMRRTPVRRFGAREVVAVGLARGPWDDLYHELLTMPWRSFFGLLVAAYVAVNLLFAVGYWLLGDAIENAVPGSFADDFFFSVQTMATIGYGKLGPRTLAANALVAVEALVGMIALAVMTGLVFARFSRPTARVLFSRVAVVAPYDGVPSLMFRMANTRGSQIAEARLRVALVRNELTREGESVRRVHDLALRRSEHTAFALTWTAVHPLDERSPLHGQDAAAMREANTDFIISLTGIDEGLAQSIHTRYAYAAEDIVWNARFADILTAGAERVVIDYARFHDTIALGSAAPAAHAPDEVAQGGVRRVH
jgi:inward rectifier potassium channel